MEMEEHELTKREKKLVETLSKCDDFGEPVHYLRTLKRLGERFRQDHGLKDLAAVLAAMGNEQRLLILEALREKDRCVCELEAISSMSQPSVSHHLRVLEKAGLIRGWKKGKFTHYSFCKERFDEVISKINDWYESIKNWV